ncbi:MAG TPA: O-antigen ligase family protein [Solirubrobacteraceae bacterium]|nr:O-antigen ligase family protein [Solirubrobacteraceae bacterium]
MPLLAAVDSTAAIPDVVRVLGVVALAALGAAAMVAPRTSARAAAVLGALVLGPVLLVLEIWHAPQLSFARDRPLVALGGGALAAAAVCVPLAVLFARRPWVMTLCAVAALPFRIPVEAGGETANLLVPLYLVIAAGGLAWAVPRLRADAPAPRAPRLLEIFLAASIVLYALQSAYSSDLDKAIEQTVFFYAPFALLFVVMRDLNWSPRRLHAVFRVLVALALVFVAVGFWEYATRRLLLNPKVIASNEYEQYFRVNSLFFDPNIYGRFLSVVMLGLAAILLWSQRPRLAAAATAGLAVLWGGLVLTLSQSSFAGLLCGLLVLAALRFSWRAVAPALAALAMAGVLILVVFPGAIGLDLGDAKRLDDATSGRYELVQGGLELAGDRPLLGWGAGAFAEEYDRHADAGTPPAVSASHTIPITVAAEQGIVGLLVYLALLVVALRQLLHDATGNPYRAVVAAAVVAIVVHTWAYAAFLEDPLIWTLLAIGTALARPRPTADNAATRRTAAPSRGARTRPRATPSASTGAR